MRRIALLRSVAILATLLIGCGGNKAPNQPSEAPTSLQQFRADGTSIDVGDATDDQSVILKATVSGSGDDRVQLEVELRRLDELARGFSGEPTHQSGWVSGGAIASILTEGKGAAG